MAALSARGHLTPGAVVIRLGEAGGARQRGWALAWRRRRERGRERARAPEPFSAAARSLACCLLPPSCSTRSALPPASLFRPQVGGARVLSREQNRRGGAAPAGKARGVRGERPPAGEGARGSLRVGWSGCLMQGACMRGGAGRACAVASGGARAAARSRPGRDLGLEACVSQLTFPGPWPRRLELDPPPLPATGRACPAGHGDQACVRAFVSAFIKAGSVNRHQCQARGRRGGRGGARDQRPCPMPPAVQCSGQERGHWRRPQAFPGSRVLLREKRLLRILTFYLLRGSSRGACAPLPLVQTQHLVIYRRFFSGHFDPK